MPVIGKCCNRSILLTKLLILFMGTVLLLLIRILSASIVPHCTSKICQNNECLNKASQLLKRMDLQIDPCEDFYKFACGSFIAGKESDNDAYTELKQTVAKQLSELIMTPKHTQKNRYLSLPHVFYKACTNHEALTKLDLQPVKDVLKQLNKWPYFCRDCSGSTFWPDLIKSAQRLGLETNYIIGFGLEMHPGNSEKLVMTINKPKFSLEPTYLFKGFEHPEVKALYDSLVKMAIKLDATPETAGSAVRAAMMFEMNLATISLGSSPVNIMEAYEPPYSLIPIKTLQSILPYLDWLEYINGLLSTDHSVNESEIILVRAKSYFMQLGSILGKTDHVVICDYLTLRIIKYSIPFLPDKFVLMHSALQTNKSKGADNLDSLSFLKSESREEQCLSIIPQLFPIIVGVLYARKYNNIDSKSEATEIFESIKREFLHGLQHITWLDETARRKNINKLKSTQVYIGYPEQLMDDELLIKYYEKLEIHPQRFFESYRNLRHFKRNKLLEKYFLPFKKANWEIFSQTFATNAYYYHNKNSIFIPVGMLQGQFFNPYLPKYLNYGALGYALGHEVVHGFDNVGSKYDSNGNKNDWWHSESNQEFVRMTQCLIRQYGNFQDETTMLRLDGELTLAENMADNGGLRQTYNAYKRWALRHTPEIKLPGLDFTPKQLFWISGAQLWCKVLNNETLYKQWQGTRHSPYICRVLGPLRNIPEFSQDFNCPEGSPMNPLIKCYVW